ncbi:MAG: hypothetical protein WDZ37_05210 [Solirubrobacterales bacterium]
MRRLAARPSPALVISVLALFVALGGSGYAISRIPARSVGSKQLKSGAVTASKIRKGAVTGPKIKKNAILGKYVLESSLGKVPDADRIDGLDSSTFEQSSKFRRVAVFSLANLESRDMVALGPLKLSAKCKINAAGQDDAQIIISTTQERSAFAAAGATKPDFGPATPEVERIYSAASGNPTGTVAVEDDTAGMAVAADGIQFVSQLWAGVNLFGQAGRCQFGGLVEQI